MQTRLHWYADTCTLVCMLVVIIQLCIRDCYSAAAVEIPLDQLCTELCKLPVQRRVVILSHSISAWFTVTVRFDGYATAHPQLTNHY